MLILGSKSPRRKEILSKANIPFKIITSDVIEDIKCDNPYDYAMLTAKKKAFDILTKANEDDVILCCDTIVYANNKILGKPINKENAYDMINILQGNTHKVITGVFIVNKDKCTSFYVETKVNVNKMTNNEIIEYIDTKEPYDKAGGYGIQGIFKKYIKNIDGDYYNVVGLPLDSVLNALKEFGI